MLSELFYTSTSTKINCLYLLLDSSIIHGILMQKEMYLQTTDNKNLRRRNTELVRKFPAVYFCTFRAWYQEQWVPCSHSEPCGCVIIANLMAKFLSKQATQWSDIHKIVPNLTWKQDFFSLILTIATIVIFIGAQWVMVFTEWKKPAKKILGSHQIAT